ncbi:hypothetical protein T484DRAFT_1631300, partial [Baffinella frigidus]
TPPPPTTFQTKRSLKPFPATRQRRPKLPLPRPPNPKPPPTPPAPHTPNPTHRTPHPSSLLTHPPPPPSPLPTPLPPPLPLPTSPHLTSSRGGRTWPFYTTSSGVRLWWELEEPQGPQDMEAACRRFHTRNRGGAPEEEAALAHGPADGAA